MVEKILKCYGSEIWIPRLNGFVYGFLQGVRGKGQNLVLKEVGPLGVVPEGQWVFIGPAEPEIRMDDVLELDGKAYQIRRIDLVRGTDGPVYQWGMCMERGR